MRKYIFIIIILLFTSKAFSHTSHYEGIKKIEMDVIRNGEVIGYSNYFFESAENKMTVKNYTKFKVKLLGVTVFSVFNTCSLVHFEVTFIYVHSRKHCNKTTFSVSKSHFQSLLL